MKNETRPFIRLKNKTIVEKRKHQRDKGTMVHWPAKAIRVIRRKAGGGEPLPTPDATRESHAKKAKRDSTEAEPTTARMRNQAQVDAAAEAKPPKDAAPFGCCCACAGGPPPEPSCLQPPTPRPPLWDLSLALSSFACRRVRAPLAPPGSEAGQGLEGAVDRRL